MNKTLLRVLSYIVIAIIFMTIGIFLGQKINFIKEDNITENEKISVSTIMISNKSQTSYSSNNIFIDDKLITTYTEIINSNSIKNKIKKDFPNIYNIELKSLEETGIIQVIYVCEDHTENECININKKYIDTFKEEIVKLYNINVNIVDSPTITNRIISKSVK